VNAEVPIVDARAHTCTRIETAESATRMRRNYSTRTGPVILARAVGRAGIESAAKRR